MKKMKHFSVNDIVRKRTINFQGNTQNISSGKNQNQKQRQSQQQFQKQVSQNEILASIVQQFSNFSNHSENLVPSISIEIKSQLIEIISKKLNLSLNVSKLLPKIKIKSVQNIEIVQKNNQTHKNHQGQSLSLSTRKQDYSHQPSMKSLFNLKRFSYFVLTGTMHIFSKQPSNEQLNKKKYYEEEISNQFMFFNWKQFEAQYPEHKKTKSYSQFTGFGSVFSQKEPQKDTVCQKQTNLGRNNTISKNSDLLIAESSIFVEIQNPEFQDDYINHSGMEYQKMSQIIQNFPVFNALGKKIKNYIQYFQFKEYQRNQLIYRIADPIQKFYLILKGQIVFEHHKSNPIKTALTSPNQSRKNSLHMQFTIKTETVTSGNYFGQEQMILELSQRLLTAKCKSSKVQILQISKQKFEKMLQYSDFYQSIKRSAQAKYNERKSKLQKNKQIRTKFALTQFNQQKSQELPISNKKPKIADKKSLTMSLFNTPKASCDGRYKVMHGNCIRKFSKQQNSKMSEDVNFSMLKVNPDMYQKTIDKFRKYNIKPRQKYKPQINWQLKRVWKVLNLQSILREQAQVGSPQGRKFYDSHKRYVCQISESKSLRPKTSSSTYRTKLQYIAYLQQFKSQKQN